MNSVNLITTYVSCYDTREDARRDLNEACGLRVTSGRLYEWEHGKHQPPPAAIRYMIAVSIEAAVSDALGEPLGSYSDAQYSRLIELLCIPDRENPA